MGLIGSTFVYTLFTTPDPWPDRDNPVYVFPESIALSDAHAMQLIEWGLTPGVPFEITRLTSEQDRKKPKVYEISALSSLITIKEGSVVLWEENESERNDRLRKMGRENNKEREKEVTRVYLQFTYDALVDSVLTIEFFVKTKKRPMTLASEKAGFRSSPIAVFSGKERVFSSLVHCLAVDVKLVPGVSVRPKKWKDHVFDLALHFAPAAKDDHIKNSTNPAFLSTEKPLTTASNTAVVVNTTETQPQSELQGETSNNDEKELYYNNGEREIAGDNTLARDQEGADATERATRETESGATNVVAVGQRRWLRSVRQFVTPTPPPPAVLSPTDSLASLLSPRPAVAITPSLFGAALRGPAKKLLAEDVPVPR